jgi:hypothetical protein
MGIAQSIRNAAEPWTAKEISKLKELAAENLPPSVISLRLGRPEPAILSKAMQAGITLTPLNRPPYGI